MIGRVPSILITDDDLALRESLATLFVPRGFRVLLADDGEVAVQIFRSQPIDLLLVDMHMPRLSGLETVRIVRQFKESVPCILMSADADEQLVSQATQARVFSVLRKPVSGGQVAQSVCDALRQAYNWRPERQAI